MPGKAAKVVITERQLSVLTEIAAARKSEVRMAQRAQIILLAFEKLNNEQISERVGLNEDQVGLWRRRWQGAFPRLVSIECTESRDALRKAVLEVLRDRPRSGRPPRITAEQQAKLVSMACECPEDSERPISHWTSRELADEAQQRGIVEAISPQWLRTLLERVTLKPFRFKTWLFSPDQADPDFDVRVSTICDAYLNAIDLYNTRGIHTVCIDEQTGIQALERIAPDLLPIPGYAGRREHEYKRHGTIGLFGNFHVPTGQILSPMLRQTRTELDFLENLDNLMSHDRDGQWRLIMDNLNTHNSESCVRYVAAVCGIEEDLGRKGVSGILQSVKTRARFLEDPSHRIQFIYLPRHASWLNQVEIWFGILRRKLTRACSVTSLHDLCQKIERFVDYYNATMARPFNWTFTGRLLCA